MCLPFLMLVVLLDVNFLVFHGVLAGRGKWKGWLFFFFLIAVYSTAIIFDFSVEGVKNDQF